MTYRLFALLLACALAASTALAGATEKRITGASYGFNASEGRASTAKGSGNLRKSGSFVAVARGRAGSSTFASRVLTWSVDRRTPSDRPDAPKTTLVLAVKVTSTIGSCKVGTRGTVTLVDWNEKLANGRSSDRVTVRFPAGACRAFAGTWTNAVGSEKARVEISVRY
jgi:hypothetical protein